MKRSELEAAYAEELEARAENYGWTRGLTGEALRATCREHAARVLGPGSGTVITSCAAGGRCDWLGNNPALRAAAKRFGLKKSPEFREAIRAMEG